MFRTKLYGIQLDIHRFLWQFDKDFSNGLDTLKATDAEMDFKGSFNMGMEINKPQTHIADTQYTGRAGSELQNAWRRARDHSSWYRHTGTFVQQQQPSSSKGMMSRHSPATILTSDKKCMKSWREKLSISCVRSTSKYTLQRDRLNVLRDSSDHQLSFVLII